MNNDQFRKLYKDRPTEQASEGVVHSQHALGSRRSNNRSSANGSSFAQSVRERSAFLQPAKKKFKSSDPRGSKIAAGFVDRARQRTDLETEEDERARKIAELESQLKEKTITQAEFEAARDAITDGDISATHLVKGLDRKLLERIRQGENVMNASTSEETGGEEVEDELDQLELDVTQKQKAASQKKGELASSIVASRKRTRDEIMADMKAQRKAAAEARAAAQPKLDSKWRSVAADKRNRTEIDSKGREMLVIVDEDGHVVKRMRRPAPIKTDSSETTTPTGDVLGSDIVAPAKAPTPPREEHDDSDIFEDAGTDYDPLGESEEDGEPDETKAAAAAQTEGRRNYFNEKTSTEDHETRDHFTGVEAVIAKAARLASVNDEASKEEEDSEAAARRAKYAAMLDTRDRDLEDMDMGFGASRFEDGEDDTPDKSVHLSQWSNVQNKPRNDKETSKRKSSKKERGAR